MSQRARLVREQEAARRRRNRIAMGVGVAAVAAGALWLLLSSGGGDDDASGPAVTVSMTDFAFDPDPIVLSAGDGARLEGVNDGAVAHDLLIRELGKGTPDLAPGASMVLDLSDQPAGTYEVICDLTGHVEAGMVSKITLE
jgi:plastocyanin